MEPNWHDGKTLTTLLTAILCALVILQGISVDASAPGSSPDLGSPHAVTGHVYWPNGTLEDTVSIPVTVTNNRTGESGVTTVDVMPGGPENGTYRIDLSYDAIFPSGYQSSDTIYVNCTYPHMWAKNETLVGSDTYSLCDLWLSELPLGPELVYASTGGSVIGFNGSVTIDIPAGAMASDTVVFGTYTSTTKPGSVDSIRLGPSGLTFSVPINLTWSYADLDLGGLSPQSLTVYVFENGTWTPLPTLVDLYAQHTVAQVSHFSNFSLGGAMVTGIQAGPDVMYPGTLNNPILDLAITNTDTATPDTLDYVHVVFNGSLTSDVSGVSLWNDSNDDGALDAGEAQIGMTQALAGGSTNFTGLGEVIPANTSLNVLVCLDVPLSAVIGDYVDLLVPAYGIGLTNAGLSLEAIDPAGNATVAQPLTDPHVVYGYVSNLFGTLVNAWVNVTNNRTGSTAGLMTDSQGRYDVNIGLMPGGYQDGDLILVNANDTLGQVGLNMTVVNASMFGERCDVHVGSGPYASNETPANGSVISDMQQNVTVNITATGIYPPDVSTIILEVDGVNYSWPDPALTFVNQTLIFNTSQAVGNWSMGQVVNVTLWQANDTLGNPCVNAPYSWAFSIISAYVTAAPDIRVHKSGNDINITWMPVANATSYAIYRSLETNGTGFNWSSPLGTTNDTYYVDSGALADANNYSYVVRGANGAGEGPKSNIGWKLRKVLVRNAATSSINWVALPYNSDLLTAQDLINDIGAANINYVARWVVSTQSYQNKFPVGGFNWPITPGEAVLVNMKNTINYFLVGSYNASTMVDIINNVATSSINWIALPYHSTLLTAQDLINDLGSTNVNYVSRWIVSTQSYQNKFPVGGFNWPITPGEGVLVNAKNSVLGYSLGPVVAP